MKTLATYPLFSITFLSRRRGITLVEVMFAMMVMLIAGLAVIGSVVYSRQSMELNKQQLAALHFCRRTLERASALSHITGGEVTLVPFNSPGLEIPAVVQAEFFPITGTGTVNWSSPRLKIDGSSTATSALMTDLTPGDPYLCRVSVRWDPSGTWSSREQQISMQTIVRRGVR